jgi:hypothetical protein
MTGILPPVGPDVGAVPVNAAILISALVERPICPEKLPKRARFLKHIINGIIQALDANVMFDHQLYFPSSL